MLLLLLAISAVSLIGLTDAAEKLRDYRSLARQTNAEGRVQANMLMTRLHAKDFIINANEENIERIRERAQLTIEMINESRELNTNPGYGLIIDTVGQELDNYVASFGKVTELQARRDEIVFETLNVVGPQIEQDLTAIMESAYNDGDAEATYFGGITLRNVMLARLYANRFLIENDDASYRRAVIEFAELEKNIDRLLQSLESPERVEKATRVRNQQRVYARAFSDVHEAITSRNDIIRNQLDVIGPKVADQIERLKLAIKAEQDELGPQAEAATSQAVSFTLIFAGFSIAFGMVAAWLIGFGVSRPIRTMTRSMRDLAGGDLDAAMDIPDRNDEIREMAEAVQVFRRSMVQVQELAAEQAKATEDVRVAKEALEELNEDLETKVMERTSELAAAREAAEAANLAKSTFLANMSHELRTPMNAILGYAEMLIEEAEDIEHEDFVPDLERIHQSGMHLLALINDVLDLAKVEAGRMEAYPESFSVSALIEEAVSTSQPLMAKNDNHLSVEPSDDPGDAYQDRAKLLQTMLNLLSNAAKFTHEGQVTLTVGTQQRSGIKHLTVEVTDTGIGIAEDKLVKVFEEFGQADDSTTRDYGGTGLGLPISRKLCQLLGGELTVASAAGEGSTFTIFVPMVLPGHETAAGVEQPEPPADDKTIIDLASVRAAGGKGTVLVIDDQADVRDIVKRQLSPIGFDVVTASSGQEALSLAHEIDPVVITLDVMMPEMDGWSVLRALKADPKLREIPVVMLTMLEDRSKAYSLGAADYLVKPIDRDQLRQVISRYHDPDASQLALLVDDDESVRDLISRSLTDAGWRVHTAENGQIGLDRMAEEKPSLILLDLMMPVMDGFEFLLNKHASEVWHDIPVLVMTAKDLTDDDRHRLNGRVEQIFEKDAKSLEQLTVLVSDLADRRSPR